VPVSIINSEAISIKTRGAISIETSVPISVIASGAISTKTSGAISI
jgi:hypothetical protein